MPVYGTLFKPLQKTDENLVMKWLMCLHRSEKHKKTSVNSMTYMASDTGLSGNFLYPQDSKDISFHNKRQILVSSKI